MVMSATRLPQSVLHSPVSTTILDREMIQSSGFTSIPDLFRLIPGFQVAQATGGHYVVTYHGQEITFPTNLEVLVDGRSVYGNILASVNWNAIGIELEEIEKIEVIRGPNAPVFGANALVATINISTRQPYEETGTWIHATAGSLDTRNLLLRHANTLGKLDYRISLGYRHDTGINQKPFTQFNGKTFEPGPDFDSTTLGRFSLRANYQATPRDNIDLQYGYTGGEAATLWPETEPVHSDHQGDLVSRYEFLRWTRSLDKDGEMYLQLYHNDDDQSDKFKFGPVSTLLGITPEQVPLLLDGHPDETVDYVIADGVSERYDLELQHRFPAGKTGRIVWGAGLRQDRLRSKEHLNRTDFIDNNSARLFADTEWGATDQLFVNTGLMLEHNEIAGFYGSARVAANYRLSPQQSLRASVSHSQRSPSILDEYWDWSIKFSDGTRLDQIIFSAGGLTTEKLTAFEIGYTQLIPDSSTSLDVKLFSENANDLITFKRDESFPDPVTQDGAELKENKERFTVTGVEGQMKWQPRTGSLFSLQYSLTKSTRRRFVSLTPRTESTTTPRQTFSLLAAQQWRHGINTSLGYYRMSRKRWFLGGDRVPGYNRVDLRVARHLQGHHWQGNVELIAQNIGHSYQEYVRQNAFETRYFVRLNLKY